MPSTEPCLCQLRASKVGISVRAARARRLYERGLDRLEGRWAGSGPDGARFLADHAYARDLDLFGHGSLFQLLDTARTEAGQDTLADGQAVNVHFSPKTKTCKFDLKVTYSDDDSSAVWEKIDLCTVEKITIHYDRKADQTSATFD